MWSKNYWLIYKLRETVRNWADWHISQIFSKTSLTRRPVSYWLTLACVEQYWSALTLCAIQHQLQKWSLWKCYNIGLFDSLLEWENGRVSQRRPLNFVYSLSNKNAEITDYLLGWRVTFNIIGSVWWNNRWPPKGDNDNHFCCPWEDDTCLRGLTCMPW